MTPEPFWYFEPSVLFGKDTWYTFVPTAKMTVPAALNAVARFSVYLSTLLFITSMNPAVHPDRPGCHNFPERMVPPGEEDDRDVRELVHGDG
jgi:hypothetical protein